MNLTPRLYKTIFNSSSSLLAGFLTLLCVDRTTSMPTIQHQIKPQRDKWLNFFHTAGWEQASMLMSIEEAAILRNQDWNNNNNSSANGEADDCTSKQQKCTIRKKCQSMTGQNKSHIVIKVSLVPQFMRFFSRWQIYVPLALPRRSFLTVKTEWNIFCKIVCLFSSILRELF